jgi:RNA polymerase sigma-70 factor (ECF subfamily)
VAIAERTLAVSRSAATRITGRTPMLSEQNYFDEFFVSRLRRGDPDAEREFYDHFSAALRIKLRSLRPPEFAEDIRQETLLRVLRHLRSGRHLSQPDRIAGFVHGICRNVTLEMQRARGRHCQLLDSVSEPADPLANHEADLASSERDGIVREILAGLAPKYRDALRLVYLDEVDRREACLRLRISDAMLRLVLHRARTRFRMLIERNKRKRQVLCSPVSNQPEM